MATLFDGTFGAAVGAARGRWLIEAGVTDEARVTKQIAAALRGLKADAVKIEPTADGWSVRARKPAKLPVDRGWLGVRAGRVTALTGAPPWPEGDPRGQADFGLDPALLRAPMALFLRPAGEPHAGAVYADAVLAALTPLGVDSEAIRRLAGALAFAWAHLGEMGVGVRPEGDAFVLGLEMVTL
ncbi:MAG: hypothetical protein KC620_15110, partial [Myxococcales bacterium]|nr:hypothetical protein [Myxococcales bacterium]